MADHRQQYRLYKKDKADYVTMYLLFDKFGLENMKIELVEEYPCENLQQLRQREGFYIRNENCINKNIAGRSLCEYYQDNKDKIDELHRQYYADNKDICARRKELYNPVKQRERERHKKYAETYKKYKVENAEKISAWKREKIQCEHCEKLICRDSMLNHIRAMHENIPKLQCPHCEALLKCKRCLYSHLKNKHPEI
jgi:hypothetical protein